MNTFPVTLLSLLLHASFHSVGFAQEDDDVLGPDLLDNRCVESQFYKPYIQIRTKKISGLVVETKETPGIIDLRKFGKSFICINGAVIAYTKVIPRNLTKGQGSNNKPEDSLYQHTAKAPKDKTIQFTDGSFIVFNHTCMPVNWLHKKTKLPMVGLKAAGVFLIAPEKPSDTTPLPPSMKVMLNKKNLDYRIGDSENTIYDASFVASGPGPHCMQVGATPSIVVFQSNAKDKFDVCHWSLLNHDKADKVYKHVFRRGHKIKDYKWIDCPAGLDQEIVKDGYKHPKKGPKKKFTGNYTDSGSFEHANPPKAKKEEQVQKYYVIDLEDCESFPKFEKNHIECTYLNETSHSCKDFELLNVALELEPSKEDPSLPPPATTPSLKAMKGLRWKHEMLSLVGFIFSKVCLPIRKQSAFQMIRLVEMYLAKAHSSKSSGNFSNFVEKSDQWEEILSLLLRCNQDIGTKPMEWDWNEVIVEPFNSTPAAAAAPAAAAPAAKAPPVKGRSLGGGEADPPVQPNPVSDPEKDEAPKKISKKDVIAAVRKLKHAAKGRSLTPPLVQPIKTIKSKYGRDLWSRREVNMPRTTLKRNEAKVSIFEDTDPTMEYEDFKGDGGKNLRIRRSSTENKPVENYNYYALNDIILGTIPRWIRMEGAEKLPLPFIQEYTPPLPKKGASNITHEDFVHYPDPKLIRITGKSEKQIFFCRELAELPFDLNPAIDAFWKMFSTALGYCQKYDSSKGHELFANAFKGFKDFFLNGLIDEWKHPSPSTVKQLELVAGEFLDDDRNSWLDTCLETSYILTDSIHLRPKRPLKVEVIENTEGGVGDANLRENDCISYAEDEKDGATKYFIPSKKPTQKIH